MAACVTVCVVCSLEADHLGVGLQARHAHRGGHLSEQHRGVRAAAAEEEVVDSPRPAAPRRQQLALADAAAPGLSGAISTTLRRCPPGPGAAGSRAGAARGASSGFLAASETPRPGRRAALTYENMPAGCSELWRGRRRSGGSGGGGGGVALALRWGPPNWDRTCACEGEQDALRCSAAWA